MVIIENAKTINGQVQIPELKDNEVASVLQRKIHCTYTKNQTNTKKEIDENS